MPAPSWSSAAQAQMSGQFVRCAVFLRIATDPVVRIWSGAGDFALASDSVEPGGATYAGLGVLVSLPKLQQLVNGVAEKVDFALSGVDADVLNLAVGDAAGIQGAVVNLGVVFLGSDEQPVSPTAWLWSGEAQSLKINRRTSAGQVSRIVSLNVASAFSRRRRPALSYFTDADQQALHSGDTFCQRVVTYVMSVVKVWPVF